MEKIRAVRNRTLTLSKTEEDQYFSRCIQITEKVEAEDIINRTVSGDSLRILPCLPAGFVDLLIVDPPYNLNKNYNGNGFRKMSDRSYKTYTQEWLSKITRVLKPDASVYVCCDWRTSILIGEALSDYFIVRNRITWQREKGAGSFKKLEKRDGGHLVCNLFKKLYVSYRGRKGPAKSRCALSDRRETKGLGGNGKREFQKHLPVEFLG